MRKMKISGKLFLLTSVMGFVIVGIGILGIYNLGIVNQSLEKVYNQQVIPMVLLKQLSDEYSVNVVDASNKLRNNNISWDEAGQMLDKAQVNISRVWETLDSINKSRKAYQLYVETDSILTSSLPLIKELSSIIDKRDTTGIDFYILFNLYPGIEPIQKNIARLLKVETDNVEHEYLSAKSEYLHVKIVAFILILCSLITSVIFAIYLIMSIKKSISIANVAIEKLSKGDLTTKIRIDSSDEMGIMLENMQNMVTKFRDTLSIVHRNIEAIDQSSKEFQSESEQIFNASNLYATSLEEISASIEEMVSTMQQNSEHALQTEKISTMTAQTITKVGEASHLSLNMIKDINNKIKIVNDIAFQTNILALNAAVEAANAKENGRGFSVVANEVRNLAENTKREAIEIIKLSSESVKATEDAEKLVEVMMPEVQKTSVLIQNITQSVIEQNLVANQINNAIQQLNSTTQQNVTTAEQIAYSSNYLYEMSETLKEGISFFKIR